ncbi:MAG: DUF2065 domain-containing protein [Kordiimonadaceae bacterium]|nr:DUF2065 domain-containing protein [Kordiimonadaceae bacterium]
MTEFIIALGLLFIIEGFIYAFFPASMKRMIKLVLEQDENSIRLVGLVAVFIGLVIIYMFK